MPLVKLCTSRGWHYLLRVCGEYTCRRFFNGKLEQSWKRFEQIVLKPGYRWYGTARVWQEETLETYVSLVWDPGCEEPWLLLPSTPAW
jgi:hypothetical protein